MRKSPRSQHEDIFSAYEDGVSYNYTPLDTMIYEWDLRVEARGSVPAATLPVELAVAGCRVRREGDALHVMALYNLRGDCRGSIDYIAEITGLPLDPESTSIAFCSTFTRNGWSGEPAFMLMRNDSYASMAGYWEHEGDDWLFGSADFAYYGYLLTQMLASSHVVLDDLVRLGSYFRFRKDRIVVESGKAPSEPAPAGDTRSKGERRDKKRKFKVVSALRIVSVPDGSRRKKTDAGRRYTPPDHAVEVDWHWRTLSPGSIGTGPNGEPVVGRTFVSGHRRWKDKPERPRTVFVKQPVAPHLDEIRT